MTKLEEIKNYNLSQMIDFLCELINKGEQAIDSEWCYAMCEHRGEDGLCTLEGCETESQTAEENVADYLNHEFKEARNEV